MSKIKFGRRAFLQAGAALTPALTVSSQAYGWFWKNKERKAYERKQWIGYRFPDGASRSIFSCGIASGDPQSNGVVLWTRIAPEQYRADASLGFEVSLDPDFAPDSRVLEGEISGRFISEANDYTIQAQIQESLQPCSTYYYRFKYRGTYSPTGRCRTLPHADQKLHELNLANVSCQDYSNGFYSAYSHLAHNSEIDFVIHLGDFIYETTGDTGFQDGALKERAFKLSSGGTVAKNLADYRELYRKYRSDLRLQEAMAAHTWIMVPDDHECANDFFWDYETQTPVMPDHPFQGIENETQRFDSSIGLRLASQKAWTEYIPSSARLQVGDDDPFTRLKIYRSFNFGELANLMMIDTRSYRSAPPCGLDTIGGRYLPKLECNAYENDDRTMLGQNQKDWLFESLEQNQSRWPIIGNQTFMGSLKLQAPQKGIPINLDAWDGFEFERRQLAQVMQDQGHNNHIVMTGDLHTYISSHLKVDYGALSPLNFENHVGAEFMTSSVTSAGLNDQLLTALKTDNRGIANGARYAIEALVRVQNPHIKRFNSDDHGYSLLRFRRYHMEWLAIRFNKNQKDAPAEVVHHLRKQLHLPWVFRDPDSEVDAGIFRQV